MSTKTKVMIVDDSALVRQVITQAISRDPSIEVVATAQDPIFALEKLKTLWPDVIVLDIEMPRMDGLTFLKKIMAERPTPIIICSSLAESGAQVTMEALAAGAVSIITKPKIDLKAFLQDSANDIVANIKAAARANMKAVRRIATTAGLPLLNRQKLSADVMLPSAHTGARMYGTTDKLIAIGTSTGGTQALEAVLTRLPSTEMPHFYQGLDVLVLPSRTAPNWKEQFGRVLIEAMACGVPVIGAASGEIPQVIGHAGLTFAEGDVDGLRAQLQRLQQDGGLWCELAARGRARVLALYTQARVAALTVAAYQAAVAASTRWQGRYGPLPLAG